MNNIVSRQKESLHEILFNKINNYLHSVDTKTLTNLQGMYLAEIEPPLLEATLEKTRFNQVQTAKMLGISRGTLRKKLTHYFGDKYCTTRED